MLSTLLATKLHRPRPTTNLVARPRLTQRLDDGLREGHRLFLVVPPRAMASCGTYKTMILE
jgi:ATP/maltotriose-dependent transcriptional regulator MalT